MAVRAVIWPLCQSRSRTRRDRVPITSSQVRNASEDMNSATAVVSWRPHAQLQEENGDCGIAAAAALAAMYGVPVSPHALRTLAGNTLRGLTLRNVRDLLRLSGFGAEVVVIAKGAAGDPTPCIALWRKTHFVVLGRTRRATREVFDPGRGWRRIERAELAVSVGQMTICITSVPKRSLLPLREPFPLFPWLRLFDVRKPLLAIGAGVLFAQVFALVLPRISGRVLDGALGAAATLSSPIALSLFAAASLFSLLGRSVTAELMARLSRYLATAMTADISQRVFAKPVDYLRSQIPEMLGARVLGAASLRQLVANDLPMLIFNGLLLLGSLVMMLLGSPIIALLAVLGVGVKAIIDYWARPKLDAAANAEFLAGVRHQSTLNDCLRAIHALRQYLAVPRVLARLQEEAAEHATAHYERDRIARLQQARHGVIDVLDRLLFLSVGAWLIERLGISAGAFVALSLYRESLVNSLEGLRQTYANLNNARTTAERLEHIVQSETLGAAPAPALPGEVSNGSVSVRNLTFRYGLFYPEVFAQLNLEIPEGQNLAIVAPSGGGKSTLAKLICGALRPQAGEICIGGINMFGDQAELPLRAIGAVMQDDPLFAGTIRDNIDMFRDLGQPAIEEAAKAAEIHDFIVSLPMRYDTLVNEEILAVSGGQRQRLLLARALCGRAKVLVLDEATSQLDVATEKLILERIRARGVTIIMFAHRPEAIKHADRVLHLNHDGLVARVAA